MNLKKFEKYIKLDETNDVEKLRYGDLLKKELLKLFQKESNGEYV